MREFRTRIAYNCQLTRELLLGAIETLSKVKEAHDKLEKCYINAMDFNALSTFAARKADEILIHNAQLPYNKVFTIKNKRYKIVNNYLKQIIAQQFLSC